jgi:hypothetical protein
MGCRDWAAIPAYSGLNERGLKKILPDKNHDPIFPDGPAPHLSWLFHPCRSFHLVVEAIKPLLRLPHFLVLAMLFDG